MNVPSKNIAGWTNIYAIIALLLLISVIMIIVTRWIKNHKDDKNKNAEVKLAGESSLQNDAYKKAFTPGKGISLVELKKRADEFENSGRAKIIGDLIYNAKGVTDDDEDAVYSGFGMLRNKEEIVFLNNFFGRRHGYDLYGYIQSFLNAEEMKNVYDIVKKLK